MDKTYRSTSKLAYLFSKHLSDMAFSASVAHYYKGTTNNFKLESFEEADCIIIAAEDLKEVVAELLKLNPIRFQVWNSARGLFEDPTSHPTS